MKFSKLSSKVKLIVSASCILLVSSYLASCGGGGASSSPIAIIGEGINVNPAFDLKGFIECGDQGKTLDLKVKTHVAFGLESENRFVYLYAQTGKLLLSAEVFGNDPVPSKYKKGYCKVVTADNNDAAVFSAALAKLSSHLSGTSVLSATQLQEQNDRITQTLYTLVDNEANISQAFSLLTAYESKEKGAFFLNTKTKNGFPNYSGKVDGFEIDRAVLAIQQSIFDIAYTPAAMATYKGLLNGKKFNSSDWFPGKVKAPAVAATIYTAKINATMAEDTALRTAFSTSFARRPTGYYLAAGDIAKVTVPASIPKDGSFKIRVGANVHDKYIKSTIARPFRVSNQFPIVSEITEIANPYGGGIYIDVPYLAKAGASVDITIQNAVPAPFFSSTAINPTTPAQWKEIQRLHPAPWADFMSDRYMMTLPTSWIYAYEDPTALMKDWDVRMNVVSKLLGKKEVRNNQVLYNIVDTSLYSDAFGIGYPTGNNGYMPSDATNGNNKSWLLTPGKGFSDVEFHELGHAQLFSDFDGEGEASVNLLAVAVANQLYGINIDAGLGRSMNGTPHIGREVAAVNWMVTQNFRLGKAMDITSSEKNEVRYQQRGYAKYVEVAALFGWGALESFYAEEERVAQQKLTKAGGMLAKDDSRILRMSIAAKVDLTPLIHFWGVQPKNAAALAAAIATANLPSSAAIYDRLLGYRDLIPMNNAQFKLHAATFLNKDAALISGAGRSLDYGEGWYSVWLNTYGATEGMAARVALDAILGKYFPNGRPLTGK